MKVMWIGHGGLLFVSGKTRVIIDPYLSNSLSAVDGSFSRKLRIKHKLLRIKPSALILTSSLPEHTDWATIRKYLKKKYKQKIAVLSCRNTYNQMVFDNEPFKKKVMKKITKKQRIYRNANHTAFAPGMEWSIGNLTIRAVSAFSNDPTSFGVIIQDRTDGKKYYVAGPTMYNEKLYEELPDDLYAAFVPVGGEFGMMNNIDAVRFAKRLGAEYVVPVSYGMFNKRMKIDMAFQTAGRVLPKPYRIIEFTLCPLQPLFTGGLDIFYNEKIPKKKKAAEISPEEMDVDKLISEEEAYVPSSLERTTQVDIVNQDNDIEALSKNESDRIKEAKINKKAEKDAKKAEKAALKAAKKQQRIDAKKAEKAKSEEEKEGQPSENTTEPLENTTEPLENATEPNESAVSVPNTDTEESQKADTQSEAVFEATSNDVANEVIITEEKKENN